MAQRLGAGVHLLELGWPAPLGANAYVVEDGETTLIDAGLPLNSPGIREELADAGVEVGGVDRVLITHYDLDHVGGLARLLPDLDAPVYVGRDDLGLLSGSTEPPLLHHKGLFHRGLRAVYRLPRELEFRPVDDGDRIGGFLAFHTPGHNPGHTAYVHAGRSAGLLGDLVWEDGGALTTPVWLDSYDMAELKRSVRRLAANSPAFEIACVAHGEPLRAGGLPALRDLADRLEEVSDWLP